MNKGDLSEKNKKKEIDPFDDMYLFHDAILSIFPEFYNHAYVITKKEDMCKLFNSIFSHKYNNSIEFNTGKTTFTMANNIYDLAGNVWEWTQEAIRADSRAVRGGCYSDFGVGSFGPASYRSNNSPDNSDDDSIRFSSHFNN